MNKELNNVNATEGNIEIKPDKYATLKEENFQLNTMLEKKNKDMLELIEDFSNFVGIMYAIANQSKMTEKEMREDILEYVNRAITEKSLETL